MLSGWIELNGCILDEHEAEELEPEALAYAGGEFLLTTPELSARDCYGIYPSKTIDAGTVRTNEKLFSVHPRVPDGLSLAGAIEESVRLRTTKDAVVTLSGGVDSTLVAVLSGLPAIAVGVPESHDLLAAEHAADVLGLSLRIHEITEGEVETALYDVLKLLPECTPMDVEIAITGWFISRLAKEQHARRILTGQAADELFAGYSRYGATSTLRRYMDADFLGLFRQRERDSTIASSFGVWYSLPFMDERVVRLSRSFQPEDLVCGDQRKISLRKVAEHYLPSDIAWKPKKAMQYGSGVTKILSRMAKEKGFRTTHELIENIR